MSILYTVMPMERVFGSAPISQPDAAPAESPAAAPVQVALGGARFVDVLPGAGGMGTVWRLYSTNPADYLDPALQPGAAYRLP